MKKKLRRDLTALSPIVPGYRYIFILVQTIGLWYCLVHWLDDLLPMNAFFQVLTILTGTTMTAVISHYSSIIRILLAILFSIVWAYLLYEAITGSPGVKINPWGAFWLAFTTSLVLNKALLKGNQGRRDLRP